MGYSITKGFFVLEVYLRYCVIILFRAAVFFVDFVVQLYPKFKCQQKCMPPLVMNIIFWNLQSEV